MTENNLLKGFSTEGFRNYDQKYSGKLDSGVEWNSSRSSLLTDTNHAFDTANKLLQ